MERRTKIAVAVVGGIAAAGILWFLFRPETEEEAAHNQRLGTTGSSSRVNIQALLAQAGRR